MENAKRKAVIRNKTAKRKETDEGAMGTGSSRPSAKRLMLKGDCAPKKQRVSTELVIGLMAEGNKTVTLAKHGGGKGLMVPPPGSQKKPPVLLGKTQSMPWESFLLSSAVRTMKILEITQRRPWGRRVYSALPR